MSEQNPSEQTIPEPVEEPAAEKIRFRDRVFGLWAVVAVALAALILGGLGATTIHAVADGGDRGGGPGHHAEFRGPDSRDGSGDRGHRGLPPGVPGQIPPTTPPSETPSDDAT